MIASAVHFLHDSPYADWFVTNCKASQSNVQCEYYVISKKPAYVISPQVKILEDDSFELREVIKRLNNGKVKSFVYIHYLEYHKAKIINALDNKNISVVWILWSDDLYSLPQLKFNMYDNFSAGYVKNIEPRLTLKQRLGRLKMQYWDGINLKRHNHWNDINAAIKKINYCATDMKLEVDVVKQQLNPTVMWVPFSYVSALNGTTVHDTRKNKSTILIGNSADPANNHFEVLNTLSHLKVTDPVLLPLSYGDTAYVENLGDAIKKLRLPNVTCLREFLKKEEYYDMLAGVKVAIMPHNVQQAFGNVIALIDYGAKLFFKKQNLLYSQLNLWGVKVYTIETDLISLDSLSPLNDEQVKHNREALARIVSTEAVLEKYRHLLNLSIVNA